jgi:hypothetical protein
MQIKIITRQSKFYKMVNYENILFFIALTDWIIVDKELERM